MVDSFELTQTMRMKRMSKLNEEQGHENQDQDQNQESIDGNQSKGLRISEEGEVKIHGGLRDCMFEIIPNRSSNRFFNLLKYQTLHSRSPKKDEK